MGLLREQCIPLHQPEGEPSLDFIQPYSPLDESKRRSDFVSAVDSLNELKRSYGSVSPLAVWHLIRRGVLANRTAENLESIANAHGYTIRHLFQSLSQAA